MSDHRAERRKIRAIIIGVGAVGRDIVLHILDKGVDIVGCVDIDPNKIGRDLGEFLEVEPIGVKIEGSLEEVLEKKEADVAIISTVTRIQDGYEIFKACVQHKINVITSAEDCYHYERTNGKLGEKLDQLAKEHDVTVLGTGIQDVFYSTLSTALASACHNVQKITGTNYAILDNFGVISCRKNGVGMTLEEFKEADPTKENQHPNAFTIALYDIAKYMGLRVSKEVEERRPLLSRSDQDMYCPAYKETIPAGNVIGTQYHTELETEEGIMLEADFYEKLAEEGETGICKWVVTGDPCLELSMPDMRGEHTTASAMIARIPDVIHAEAGFLTVAALGHPRYYVRRLNEYVDAEDLEK